MNGSATAIVVYHQSSVCAVLSAACRWCTDLHLFHLLQSPYYTLYTLLRHHVWPFCSDNYIAQYTTWKKNENITNVYVGTAIIYIYNIHSNTTILGLMATTVGNLNSIRLNKTIRQWRQILPIIFFFCPSLVPSLPSRHGCVFSIVYCHICLHHDEYGNLLKKMLIFLIVSSEKRNTLPTKRPTRDLLSQSIYFCSYSTYIVHCTRIMKYKYSVTPGDDALNSTSIAITYSLGQNIIRTR